MPVSKSTLSEQDRARLDTIVSQMQTNGETEESIRLVVDDFKTKYSKKKESGEESGNGTQNIAQSSSPSISEPTAAQILNPLFGIQERQMQQSTLLPQPVTPIGKTESQIQQEESQNAFYDKILPTDRLGKKLIQMPNGASISIDPRTIPFSPSIIDNDPDVYISKVRDKINKGEILTPVEKSFISKNQRPISKFTIEDDEQLDILKNANGVNIEAIQDIRIPSQLTNLIPSLAGKTFGEVASTPEGKYVQTQELKRRITRELQSEENKTTGGTGDIKDTQKIAALKEQLDDVSNLETKLSRSLTKISEQEVEGVVRTDESGSNWERFKNSVGGVVNPSWVAPPEVIDRFEKLPKEFVTGLNYLKFKEPVVYKRVSNYLVTGQPISESQIAEITHYGLDIEKEKLQDKFVNQEIDQDQYRTGENDISLRAYNNLVGNKEALRGFLSSNIAELADADNVIGARMEEAGNSAVYGVNKIFGHRWNYTDEEILNYATQVARANGIDVNDARVQDAIKYLQDNEGAMIMQNSVAKAGWTRDLAKGLAQPIRGIASSISDIPKTDAEVYAESQSQGNVNVSEQKLKRVENSWEGTVSDVLEGTGQFITQAGLAYATGGGLSALGRGILGRAGVAAIEGEIAAADMGVSDLIGSSLIKSKDAISTFVTSYAQSYDNNLKTALSYTDNDATATIVANSMSFLEGATENFLSPIQVARGIGSRLFNKQTTSKGLVDILSDAEIVDKKSAVADFLKKSLTAGLGTAKVAGTEIGEELVTGLADYTANAILNPNSQTFQDRDLLNEVANTAYQTGLSMAIPALVSGASSYNTNNFAKGSLIIAAQNRQALLDDMNVRLSEGSMSQDQYNEKAQIINTAATANEELPSKENGSKLNSDEKADYVFSRVSEAILSKRLAVTEDQAEKNILEGKIKEQQNLRTKILKNEGNQVPENQNAEVATTQSESAVTAETENTEVATPATNLADEQTVKLLNENAANINIPTYRSLAANADAQMATDILKEVAGQWYDPRSREAAERNFTKPVTDAAIRLFPNQEQDDEISFEKVVAIEPLLTRVDANEAINDTELNDAENILYEELDRNPNAAPLIEPYILKLQNHENRTTTETVTVAEEIPVENANGIAQRQQVRPALEQSTGTTASITRADGTTVNGQLNVVDGNYVIQSEEGDIIVGEKAITDRDLSLPEEAVMDNPVELDNDGNVSAVTFQTPTGDLIKITDPEKALDLAIQLQAQEVGEVPDGVFNQAYETVQKEIQIEVPIRYAADVQGSNIENIPFEQRTDKQHSDFIKNKFIKEFTNKGVTQEQMQAAVALMEARSKASGLGDKWYRQIEDVRNGEFSAGDVKYQGEWKKIVMAAAMTLQPLNYGGKLLFDKKSDSSKIEKKSSPNDQDRIQKLITDYYAVNNQKAPQEAIDRAIEVWEKFGKPVIIPDSTSKNERAFSNQGIRDGRIIIDTISQITNFDDFVAEMSHAAQYQSGTPLNSGVYKTKEERDKYEYNREGSIEYDAHKLIEPLLTTFILTGKRGYDLTISTIESMPPSLRDKILPAAEKFKINFQNNKGALETLENGRKVIHALESPDFSTAVHELAHIFEDELTEVDREKIKNWAGTENWNIETSEAFARGFERYLRDGDAPTESLRSIFQRAKEWLQSIYNDIIGSPINRKISPEVKKIFDSLLSPPATVEREKATSPKVVPYVTGNEGEEGIAMTHAATAETLSEFALPEYQKEAQTFAQWDEEATQNIKDGKMPLLLDKLRNNGEATPVEVRMLGMYIANLKTIASQTKSDADIQKMYEAIKLSDALGSKEGKALTARRGLFMNGDTLADYFQEEMDATAVDTLTPEQKTTAEKEHTDISEAQAAWDIERERLNKQILELQAQAALKKEAAAAAKIKIKKTHEDFVKERQKITDDIREKLRKARSGTNVTIVPYANELFAIAPDVAKLVKSLAQEGIITLTDMVSALKDTLGDAIPQATDSDYRDLIAGAYNEKGKTKNQLAKDLFDLREEARLINKLAALEAGEEPDAPKAKVKRNQQITELRKKIEQFRRDNPTDKDKLAAVKKSYETRIAKIEEDLRTGNFLNNPEPPPTVKLDAEALAAKDKLIKLKNERKLRLLRAEYESRSDVKKGLDVAANILNVPRALMTTLDFSAVLRQGLIPTLSNPTMAIKSAGQMFKSAWTQEAYDRWFYDLENSDSYDTMIDSGLALTDNNNPTLTVKEEAFMSNIVEKIPLVGETLNVKGVKVPGANLIKKSQRAYTAYINKMRVDLFNKFSSAMEEKGMTFENSPEQYKQMAEYINNATGRGSLGKALNKVSPLLNGIFFSPRLIASRLNMLTYLAQPRFYKTVPKVVRDAYFKDMATFAALGNTVLALAYFAGQSGDGEDKDKVTVGYDPRSSDFGKIKSGNTRWDIWGGFQPFMRVAGQILSGQRKSTKTGKVTELNGEGPFSSSRSDVLLSFARGKLAPVPAMSVDLFSKRTAAGEKIIFELNPAERNKQISIGQYAKEHLLPLTYTGVEESMKEDGVRALLTVAVPSIFGIGVQTFGSDEIKIIDDLPKVGPKQLERLEEKGIKTLEDLKKYKGRLGTLRYENEDGEKKKIFNKPQIKSIDSIFNLKPKK